MGREKSPGVKILWLWTIGTAAILVTSVVRTRLRELENVMNAQRQEEDATFTDSPPSEQIILEDKV